MSIECLNVTPMVVIDPGAALLGESPSRMTFVTRPGDGRSYELIGPAGQKPAGPFAGGLGAQTAAITSSGSRDRMRGGSYDFFFGGAGFAAGVSVTQFLQKAGR